MAVGGLAAGGGRRVALHELADRGPLLVVHDPEADVDLGDAVEGLHGAGDPIGDLGPQRAACDGEGDLDLDGAAVDGDALDHAEVDDRAVQLRILDRAQRVDDEGFGHSHGVLTYRGHGAIPQQPPAPAAPLSPVDFSAAVTAITSAFGDPTRRDIYLWIRERSAEDGTVTASEVAERFELHPNVARHHLDKLAGGGYVEVSSGKGHTGAGRPSKRYSVTERAMALEFPVRHDDLLVTLLGKALSRLPRAEAEAMAEEVGCRVRPPDGRHGARRRRPGPVVPGRRSMPLPTP